MSSPRPVSTDSSRTNAVAPAGTAAPATERNAAPTLNECLENLPFTRAHGKLLGISGLGWALDAMDVGLISFVMAALIKEWHLSPTEASWLGSIGFVGMALGATFGGLLADKLGRRYIFALTLLIYGLATGASALATSLGVLLVFRFLVGLGLGAELPVASTLISEFSPRAIRGRVVVALEAFWALGWILAALIGTFIVPQANGWRWALAIGLIPAIYSLVIRMGTPSRCASSSRSASTIRHARWSNVSRPPPRSSPEPVRSRPKTLPHTVPQKVLTTQNPRKSTPSGLPVSAARPSPCASSGSASTSPTTARSSGFRRC